ncbi:hypothetical protein BD408DRAFT_435288 [Parasitella parasitica]|nr:hypothetical protein BD408DRAFT_435288 [Parasitella parasitica]
MTSRQPVHSVLFDNNQNQYYGQPQTSTPSAGGDGLQFYSSNYGDQYNSNTNNYYSSPPTGDMHTPNYNYTTGSSGSFWSAFGTGGFADEPPLLEELGLNFGHIKSKSLAVLNPFRTVPHTIMDDTDLAGPLLFIFLFGTFLLLSRKAHFGYIYGVGVMGVVSIYLILNMMSENGIDWSRTASVLGYCLLPMVMLSGFSVVLKLDNIIGTALTVIEAYIPESKLYNELREFEKNLDMAIMRKRLDIQEALGKPTKVRRTLRIFVSNTAADQPEQLDEPTNFESNDDNAPSWTLRIEGRLLDPLIPTKKAQPVQKFTSFFKSIIVELDRDPEVFPEGNITEWHKQANSLDADGVELKRKGDVDVNARIILVPDFNPQKYKLSAALSGIISPPLATKPHIITELWNYIKLHQLHDKQDKRVIQCDEKLTDLFGSSRLQLSDLPELINRHLSQPDPIVLEYKIRVNKQFNQGPVAYDMDVELDSILRQKMMNVISSSQPQKDAMALDDKIVQCVQSINNSKVKRDFLTQFSMNPIEFINKWIISQARDLEAILGETKVNLEDVRQTDFYKQPWVKEAVFHYLTSKTQQRMQELLATQQK